MINRKVLAQCLFPEETQTPHAISYEKEGTGLWDKSLWAEGEEDVWIQDSSRGKTTLKKIIISSEMLKERALCLEEVDLLHVLTKEYDVYIWPGPPHKIDQLELIQTTAHFFEKLPSMYAASTSNIKKEFGRQNISPDDYTILDGIGYSEFLKKNV